MNACYYGSIKLISGKTNVSVIFSLVGSFEVSRNCHRMVPFFFT